MELNPLLSQLEGLCFTAALVLYLAATALYFVFFAARQEKAGARHQRRPPAADQPV